MLELRDVKAAYEKMTILKGISLGVKKEEIATLIGANGAGKTTTVRTIMGLLHPLEGSILFDGEDISRLNPYQIVARGISLVPEGRKIFSKLTVLENLKIGTFVKWDSRTIAKGLKRTFELFPVLNDRKNQLGGTLSGGEQQMLALGRGLMSNPKVLLLDEPSMGLAPILVESVFETVKKINGEGTTILLVEQNGYLALWIANYGFVIERGTITLQGDSKNLLQNDEVQKYYLGG